jgi:hypothetical protein
VNAGQAGPDKDHDPPSGAAAMINEAFAAFLHALPYLLGGLVLLGGIYGFVVGLSLKPHKDGHRPGPNRVFWWER